MIHFLVFFYFSIRIPYREADGIGILEKKKGTSRENYLSEFWENFWSRWLWIFGEILMQAIVIANVI